MTRLVITSQKQFDAALKSGAFNTATDVWLDNLPLVQAKPVIAKRGSLYRNGRV